MLNDRVLDELKPRSALVVDDDSGINRLLQVRLKGMGFTVGSAADGEQALESLKDSLPDLMMLDVSMPGVGGIEVLKHIRSQQMDVAVIMTTAFGSESVAITALREGADDYLRKPFEPEEFRRVVERSSDKLFLTRQNRVMREQLDSELRQAADIQAGLLPHSVPYMEGYELAGYCEPAHEVGGDFYDWQFQPGGPLSITLGDVMGKGMPAALLMATVRAAIRPIALTMNPFECITAVEQSLHRDLAQSHSFITLFHAQIEPQTGDMRYVDAGHGLAAILRANGQTEALGPSSLPIGVLDEAGIVEGVGRLLPGDSLIVYSDGLAEGNLANVNTASAFDSSSADRIARSLVQLSAQQGDSEDDRTVIVVHRKHLSAT